jgi:AhpD family alkylhydroperoxidase
MKKDFNKRLYPNLKEFLTDLGYILKHRGEMKSLMRGEQIKTRFRERLMLAVTEVNGCRYCSYYHSRQALKAGIGSEELEDIAAMSFESSPEAQRPALLYAQHWAESNAQPDSAAWDCMQKSYSPKELEHILLSLRVIRMGNLLGNLYDFLLFKLSFGRIGFENSLKIERG